MKHLTLRRRRVAWPSFLGAGLIPHDPPRGESGKLEEACRLCREVSRLDFRISEELWLQVLPRDPGNDPICLWCFMKLAKEQNVRVALADEDLSVNVEPLAPVHWPCLERTAEIIQELQSDPEDRQLLADIKANRPGLIARAAGWLFPPTSRILRSR